MTDERAWPAGTATGIGSLPLDDVDEACRVVVGELPDLPHLPELPGRGPGAGLVGRTVALLVDLHADVQPSGWRLVDRPGRDEERAVSWLRRDLDALEIAAHGWSGPMKLQVAGPLTTAASLERLRGDRAVGDPGARRDLAQSLAEGVGAHVADVRRRLPGARPVVQLDEPGLPVVLSGGLPTASGLGRLAPVDTAEAATLLATVLDAVRSAGAAPVVHCCAAGVPVGLLRRAGAEVVSLDVGQLRPDDLEELAAAVDDGLGLWAGVVPVTEPPGEAPTDAGISRQVLSLWRRLDQPATAAPDRVVLTPECGLAGASPAWARRAYGLARGAARALGEAAQT